MNNKLLRGSLITLVVLGLIYFLLRYAGCFHPETDGKVNIGEPIKSPVAVAFLDANPATQHKVIENLTITLIDPDGKVLSSSGTTFSEISVKTGLISLGLKTDTEVTEQKPYRFRLVAKAEGYVETIQTVILQNEAPSYFPIYMVNEDAPPPGVSFGRRNLPLASGGVMATDAEVVAPTVLGNIKLNFRKGTRLLSCGKSVEGNSPEVGIATTHGDPANPNANRVFPNGFTVTDAIDSLGQIVASPSNTFDFVSAGWVDINLQAGGQTVNGFSKPVEVEMPVSSQFINPATGLPVVAGDRIPLWSLNFQDGIWTNERNIVVEQGANGLIAKFPITHLSTWNLDAKGPRCTDDIVISYTNSGCPANLYSRVVDGAGVVYSPTSAGAISNNVLPYSPGTGQFSVRNYPLVSGLKFEVFNSSSAPAPGATPLSSVNFFGAAPACPAAGSVLTLPAFTPPAPAGGCTGVYVEIDIEDGATSYDLCGNVLWYKVHGSGDPWTVGGFFIGGTAILLSPPAAAAGFDIRIWYQTHEVIIEGISQDYFNVSNTCTGSDQEIPVIFNTGGGSTFTGATAAAIHKQCARGAGPICNFGALPTGSSPENATCTLGPGITNMSRVYINITVPAAVVGLMIGGACS